MRLKYLFLLVSSILILSIATTLSVFLYKTQKRALLEGIDNKLLTAANCIEDILPNNYHDRIVNKDSVPMNEYLEIVDTYNKLCIKIGLQYMWSLMIVNDQMVFTSGTSTGKDVTKGDHALFFDVHTNPNVYKEAFSTMNIQFSTFHDKWGEGRMVLIPKYDSKGRRYLLASSLSLNDVNTMVGKTIVNSLIISMIVLFGGLILSFILSDFLSRPIIRLTEIAEDIARGNLKQKIETRGYIELKNLSNSIETMSNSIHEKITEIENKNVELTKEIVERKQIEGALKESEERYRTVYDTAPLAFVVWDTNCHIVDWNDQAEETFGWTRAEALGKSFFDLIIPDVDRQLVEQVVANLLNGKIEKHVINRNITKEGNIIWCEWNNAILQDAQGNATAAISLGLDITDRINTENELKKHREHLEDLVEERTSALEAKNQELETFTYSVSHDLKAPLRGIDGYSRLLVEEYADQLDEEGLLFLNNVRYATEQMNQLIEDLLAYSRMERRDIQFDAIDLPDMVNMIIVEREQDLTDRNIELISNIPFQHIEGDQESLRQILGNLLDNAIKFTCEESVARIEIGGSETAKDWTLWVKDNGIGFDPKYQDRIFGIFQRLHRTEDYPGTGVGLAIVQKATNRMGGRIWAEGTLDKGAVFYVQLPKSNRPVQTKG